MIRDSDTTEKRAHLDDLTGGDLARPPCGQGDLAPDVVEVAFSPGHAYHVDVDCKKNYIIIIIISSRRSAAAAAALA